MGQHGCERDVFDPDAEQDGAGQGQPVERLVFDPEPHVIRRNVLREARQSSNRVLVEFGRAAQAPVGAVPRSARPEAGEEAFQLRAQLFVQARHRSVHEFQWMAELLLGSPHRRETNAPGNHVKAGADQDEKIRLYRPAQGGGQIDSTYSVPRRQSKHAGNLHKTVGGPGHKAEMMRGRRFNPVTAFGKDRGAIRSRTEESRGVPGPQIERIPEILRHAEEFAPMHCQEMLRSDAPILKQRDATSTWTRTTIPAHFAT